MKYLSLLTCVSGLRLVAGVHLSQMRFRVHRGSNRRLQVNDSSSYLVNFKFLEDTTCYSLLKLVRSKSRLQDCYVFHMFSQAFVYDNLHAGLQAAALTPADVKT